MGIAAIVSMIVPRPCGGVYTGPGWDPGILPGTRKLQLEVATSPVKRVTIPSLSQRLKLNGRKQICLVRSNAGEMASDAESGGIQLRPQRKLAVIWMGVNLLLLNLPAC